MAGYRKEQVGEELLSFLGTELSKLTDPRLGAVTFTDVEMTPDLKLARVFWTTHQTSLSQEAKEAPDVAGARAALASARKLLKSRAGKALGLRFTPDLDFRFDDSIRTGGRIEELLRQVADNSSNS